MVTTNGHGENDGGYGDLPLVCGGALAEKRRVKQAYDQYHDAIGGEWTREDLAYADFGVGVLLWNWRTTSLPFEINLAIAQAPERLCNQPWAADAKRRVTERARAIRNEQPPRYKTLVETHG